MKTLFAALLQVNLLLLMAIGPLLVVIQTPNLLADSLKQAGVYQAAADGLIEGFTTEAAETANGLPLNDPVVQGALKNTITADFIESQVASLGDSLTAWLEGDVSEPQFAIAIGPLKERFASEVSNAYASAYAQLPPCSLQQIRTYANTPPDPFSLECQIPNISKEQVASQISSSILTSQLINQSETITERDLTPPGQPSVFSQLQWIPTAYRLLDIVLPVLVITTIVWLVLLSKFTHPARATLKKISSMLLGIGVFTGGGTLIMRHAFMQMNTRAGNDFETAVLGAAKSIANTYFTSVLWWSAAYIIIAALLFGLYKLACKNAETALQEGTSSQ